MGNDVKSFPNIRSIGDIDRQQQARQQAEKERAEQAQREAAARHIQQQREADAQKNDDAKAAMRMTSEEYTAHAKAKAPTTKAPAAAGIPTEEPKETIKSFFQDLPNKVTDFIASAPQDLAAGAKVWGGGARELLFNKSGFDALTYFQGISDMIDAKKDINDFKRQMERAERYGLEISPEQQEVFEETFERAQKATKQEWQDLMKTMSEMNSGALQMQAAIAKMPAWAAGAVTLQAQLAGQAIGREIVEAAEVVGAWGKEAWEGFKLGFEKADTAVTAKKDAALGAAYGAMSKLFSSAAAGSHDLAEKHQSELDALRGARPTATPVSDFKDGVSGVSQGVGGLLFNNEGFDMQRVMTALIDIDDSKANLAQLENTLEAAKRYGIENGTESLNEQRQMLEDTLKGARSARAEEWADLKNAVGQTITGATSLRSAVASAPKWAKQAVEILGSQAIAWAGVQLKQVDEKIYGAAANAFGQAAKDSRLAAAQGENRLRELNHPGVERSTNLPEPTEE